MLGEGVHRKGWRKSVTEAFLIESYMGQCRRDVSDGTPTYHESARLQYRMTCGKRKER